MDQSDFYEVLRELKQGSVPIKIKEAAYECLNRFRPQKETIRLIKSYLGGLERAQSVQRQNFQEYLLVAWNNLAFSADQFAGVSGKHSRVSKEDLRGINSRRDLQKLVSERIYSSA